MTLLLHLGERITASVRIADEDAILDQGIPDRLEVFEEFLPGLEQEVAEVHGQDRVDAVDA